jgi:hypothetical protein
MKKSHLILKVLYRTIFICLLFVVFNFIYIRFFAEKDIQKHSEIINLVRSIPQESDIIYFGESSNITYAKEDTDKRKISEILNDFYPNLIVSDITKRAGHAGVYKSLLKNIPNNNNHKTIIVTLNLRSFNAQWIYSDLETALDKSLVLINNYPPIINRFLLSFKAYDIKTKKERKNQFISKWKKDVLIFPYKTNISNTYEWDKTMSLKGIKDAKGMHDYKATELACHYIKAYAFQIDTLSNPRINDFDDIVKYSKARGWNIVFNLLAENVEKAQELVGDDLVYLMKQNTDLLIDYYSRKGVVVVNNLDLVSNDQYIDQHWTTEHYAEMGRWTIATNIAEHLKQFHKKEYKFSKLQKNQQNNASFSLQQINKQIEIIKKDSVWYSSIKQKSIEQSIPIDSMLIIDATWILNENNVSPIDTNLLKVIDRINSDSLWLNKIKTKAEKNKISVDDQILLDAEWVINNENQ